MDRWMTDLPFLDSAPTAECVTAYDLAHACVYLRLLDAAADTTATWQEAVRVIFGLDPDAEPLRARQVYDSHLVRARWMTQTGYRHLASFERLGDLPSKPE